MNTTLLYPSHDMKFFKNDDAIQIHSLWIVSTDDMILTYIRNTSDCDLESLHASYHSVLLHSSKCFPTFTRDWRWFRGATSPSTRRYHATRIQFVAAINAHQHFTASTREDFYCWLILSKRSTSTVQKVYFSSCLSLSRPKCPCWRGVSLLLIPSFVPQVRTV